MAFGRFVASGISYQLAQSSRKPVFARLMNDHIGSEAMAVGEIGALSGLKVESILVESLLGIASHLVYRDIEGLVGGIVSRDTLKPKRCRMWRSLFDFSLYIDVRKNAMREDVFELKDLQYLLQGSLDAEDRFWIARHGIGTQ